MKKIVLFLILLISVPSISQKKMTKEIINEYGTKVFNAPKAEVFQTLKSVLESNDYQIDFENIEKGKIVTKKKVLGASAMRTDIGTAQITRNYRLYLVVVESIDTNKTKVVLTPKVFIGEGDVSDEKVWIIKGNTGEIKLWENIFNSIQERL